VTVVSPTGSNILLFSSFQNWQHGNSSSGDFVDSVGVACPTMRSNTKRYLDHAGTIAHKSEMYYLFHILPAINVSFIFASSLDTAAQLKILYCVASIRNAQATTKWKNDHCTSYHRFPTAVLVSTFVQYRLGSRWHAFYKFLKGQRKIPVRRSWMHYLRLLIKIWFSWMCEPGFGLTLTRECADSI